METVTGVQHQIEHWPIEQLRPNPRNPRAAIAEVSRVTDCSAIVIRTSETAGALLTALAGGVGLGRAHMAAQALVQLVDGLADGGRRARGGGRTWPAPRGEAGPLARRYSIQVMQAMGGIDIWATLVYFDSHGGHCDCEVLMNVAPSR